MIKLPVSKQWPYVSVTDQFQRVYSALETANCTEIVTFDPSTIARQARLAQCTGNDSAFGPH